jgi:hypothetical protein
MGSLMARVPARALSYPAAVGTQDAPDDLDLCPSRARCHGDSRRTTDNNVRMSLIVDEKTSLLTVGHEVDLCTAVLRHAIRLTHTHVNPGRRPDPAPLRR